LEFSVTAVSGRAKSTREPTETKKPNYAEESMSEQERTVKRERVALTSGDVSEGQVARLRELFPEVFVEGKIDFEKLKVTLGAAAESGPGRFHFSWAGKDDAVSLLQTPSAGTLVPCPEESINFETTGNVFIDGDNLEVLKLLFKPYFGRVKLIYIDPPYNTGQDFVYPDNYADPLKTYLQITGQADAEGNLLTSNPETSGRYHSTWLSMMYPRLFLARQLLSDDGVIFVSIDDHEMHHLRILMNEVFGEENRIECFIWKKSYGGGAKEKYAVTQHEYVLLYAKDLAGINDLWLPPDAAAEARYYKYQDEKFETRGPYRVKPLEATKSMDSRPNLVYPIPSPKGGEIWPKRQWWWGKERTAVALKNNELVFTGDGENLSVSYKQYLRDENGEARGAKPFSVIDGIYTQQGTADLADLFGESVIQFPKPVALIKKLINIGSNAEEGHIILDFFAGSGTTAQAVLELNREDGGDRRFVLVQLPEPTGNTKYPSITDIGKERIRRVIEKLAKDTQKGLDLKDRQQSEDVGFKVFKLAKPNIQQWSHDEERDPEAYSQKLALFNDPLVGGWKPENVIWEVALREGFGLKTQFALRDLGNGNTVYDVIDPDSEQKFMICLDDKIPIDLSKHCELTLEDLFVCRDVALDDSAAANLALQCRLKTI
jgi:adenine-specific DNA-methyltransferase